MIINVILRLLQLTSKFVLVFLLTKLFDDKVVSNYYYVNYIITWVIYVIGLDIYTYSNRKYLKGDKSVLDHHFWWTLMLGAVGMLLLIILLEYSNNHFSIYILSFYFILEFILKDLERWLVVLGEPTSSLISNNIRSSVWIFPFSILVLFFSVEITVTKVYILICSFSLISLFYSFLKIKALVPSFIFRLPSDNLTKFKTAIKGSIFIYISSLLSKTILVIDKFFVNNFVLDKSVVAAYLLFFTLAITFQTILESAYFITEFPEQLRERDLTKIKERRKKIIKVCISYYMLSAFACYLLFDYLMVAINRPYFIDLEYLFFLVLLFMLTNSVCAINKNTLYSIGKDYWIFANNLVAFVLFVLCVIYLYIYNLIAVRPELICISLILCLVIQNIIYSIQIKLLNNKLGY